MRTLFPPLTLLILPLTLLALTVLGGIFFPSTLMVSLGIVLGIAALLLVAPLFQETLSNDPQYPRKFALFTKAIPHRAKIKMRGSRPVGIIRGAEGVPKRKDTNILWWFYQRYVYSIIGLYVIGVPYFQTIASYDLPRYRIFEEDGEKTFRVVPDDDLGFRTDHVRNEITTWYFMFKGAEIETVAMTVKGSAQIRIRAGREKDAIFKTDAWNVLLDQALNSVIRGVVRAEVTLDQVIGNIAKDIWVKSSEADKDVYDKVQSTIFKKLQEYKIEEGEGAGQNLVDYIGLEIARIDIIDFVPEVTKEQLEKLMAPALNRQMARGRSLAGQGEAEYQAKVLGAAKDAGDLGKENIWAQAFTKAAEGGGVDALLAAILKKVVAS